MSCKMLLEIELSRTYFWFDSNSNTPADARLEAIQRRSMQEVLCEQTKVQGYFNVIPYNGGGIMEMPGALLFIPPCQPENQQRTYGYPINWFNFLTLQQPEKMPGPFPHTPQICTMCTYIVHFLPPKFFTLNHMDYLGGQHNLHHLAFLLFHLATRLLFAIPRPTLQLSFVDSKATQTSTIADIG